MTIRQIYVSMSMLSVLLFTGGMVLAEESKRATDPTKGNKSGTTAERSTKGQDTSGKKGKDTLGRASGEPTNPGIGTANGSDSGAGAGSGGRGDTPNAPGGTSSGGETGTGTASPGGGK
jgi:hypothetical protein